MSKLFRAIPAPSEPADLPGKAAISGGNQRVAATLTRALVPFAAPASELTDAELLQRLAGMSGEALSEEDLASIADQSGDRADADNTVRTYSNRWKHFLDFCQRRGRIPLPASPETVKLFVSEMIANSRAVATIEVTLAAIDRYHRDAGHALPGKSVTVKRTFSGYKRTCAGTPLGGQPKKPLLADDIEALCEVLDQRGDPMSIRDKAMILLGFAGAFRSCEPEILEFEDFTFDRKGMTIFLSKSKTDQEGKGTTIGIARAPRAKICPVLAMRRWMDVLAAQKITSGPITRGVKSKNKKYGAILFTEKALSPGSLRVILKAHCARAGIDPSHISWHSVRRGHVTQAFRNGASLPEVQKTGRWTNTNTVMKYHDQAEAVNSSSSRYLWK